MFNISFYVVCWLVFFLLCLPVIFAGLLAVALENDKVEVKESRLNALSQELNEFANDKAKLKPLLDEFLRPESKANIKEAIGRALQKRESK